MLSSPVKESSNYCMGRLFSLPQRERDSESSDNGLTSPAAIAPAATQSTRCPPGSTSAPARAGAWMGGRESDGGALCCGAVRGSRSCSPSSGGRVASSPYSLGSRSSSSRTATLEGLGGEKLQGGVAFTVSRARCKSFMTATQCYSIAG
jgi:hypothetical protein